MALAYPDRIDLARTPTPLEYLERTSAELGVELYLKRDDLTGAELSGNKVRKLEYLLHDAVAEGADSIVTCGGEQSNHCRATALAATRLGLASLVLLRTVDPANPPATGGNILLDRLAGAEVMWISHKEYARRGELLAREAERLRGQGRHPYIIPEGGSNAIGAWGYVGALEELIADLADLPPRSTTLVHACGSGGTAAGLILGVELTGAELAVASINVCDNRDYFTKVITSICAEFDRRYGTAANIGAADIDIVDGYVGAGYAKSREDELVCLRDMARREAIILDPVYTGKAFYGLTQELARDRKRFGERIVFIHTGGIYGLFPAADQLDPLL
jgi:D-cysteine desulfhydrase